MFNYYNKYEAYITRLLHVGSREFIVLLSVFLFGGVILYHLPKGYFYDFVAFGYPFLVGLMTVRLVWKMVSTHSQALSHVIDEMQKNSPDALPRLGISIRNHVLWLVLGGYVMISMAFAVSYHITGTVKSAVSLGDNYYFSIITLATVGYGDLVPIGLGRLLVTGEVLIGLGYQMVAIGAAVNYFSKFQQH